MDDADARSHRGGATSAPKETARAPPTAPTHVDPAPRDASAPAAAGFDADGAEPRKGRRDARGERG